MRNTCMWNPFSSHQEFSRANYIFSVETEGPAAGAFILRSGEKVLLNTDLKELASDVWVTWTSQSQRFAITWSDGGAIGGFHVRAFAIESGHVTELSAVDRAVQDFRLRHYCKTRGNNVQAYRWETPDRLVLLTSVYPASDCGADLGHTEGYVVNADNGAILVRMTPAKVNHYMQKYPEWPESVMSTER